MKSCESKIYGVLKVCLWLVFVLPGIMALQACGGEQTGQPSNSTLLASALPEIPTFTALSFSGVSGTPTPTPIVILPIATPLPPTVTPAIVPTSSPVPPATATLPPPTSAPIAQPAQNGTLQEITVQQARNFNGFQAKLPVFLPPGYKLFRLSASQTGQPRITVMVGEYRDGNGHNFYYNIQSIGSSVPVTAANPVTTRSITLTPGQPTPFTPTLTPRPTALTREFRQETVNIKGRSGLLSYDATQASLSWAEPAVQYFLTGSLTRDDIIKVAESLQ